MGTITKYKYSSKTMHLPFSSEAEEREFEAFIASRGLKKGAFVLSLVRKEMDKAKKSKGVEL